MIENIELTYEVARAVITEAQARDCYPDDASVPEAKDEAVRIAADLIEIGISEWNTSSPAQLKGELGEDIKAVLGVANIVPDESGKLDWGTEPADPSSNGASYNCDKADIDTEEPWPSYDSQTVAEITAALDDYGDLDDIEREYIHKYEKSHKNRSSIIKQVKPSEVAADGHAELDNAMDDAVAEDDIKDVTWSTGEDPPSGFVIIDGALERDPGSPTVERPHLAGVREARQQARERFLNDVRAERLPEPPSPDFEDDPVMPSDPAQITDTTLESLYFQFNACLIRATWLVGLAQVDESYCERFEKRARAEAFMRNREERPSEVREALVEKDPEVVYWSDLHGEAYEDVKGYNKLVDSYRGNVDRLSRILGFRKDERDRTR